MYTGLEKNSTGLVEEAIQLIPSLPYAYMAMATLMDNDVNKYNYYELAYNLAMNEIGEVSSITQFSLIFNLLEQKINLNKINNINCLLYTSPSPRDQRGSRIAGCG